MQSNVTLLRITGYLQKSLMILGMFFLITGKIHAQIYTNGNLSTGPTASTGDPAPAGFTWSEVQTGNQNAGFAASVAGGFTVADDFTVIGTWGVTKFTCYAYSTGYAGTTSPFNDLRLQIFNTNPSVGAPTPIFGDLTTNRFTASSSANMYRIFNGTPGLTRQIWKIEANINTSLTAGTYWVEWQVGTALASNFSPASTVVGTVTQPGNNALQHTLAPPSAWTPILDGPAATDPQDMPFQIDYTTSVCAGTPTPGNTIASVTSACPTIPFTLSTQNSTSGSGVTYQWQSSPDGVTFTDITGATNNTLSTTLTANTFYQAVVTCAGSPAGTSTPVQVTLTPSSGCYCIPASTDCTDGDIITRVVLNNLDNPSGCGPAGYTNYGIDPNIVVPDVVAGIGNPISVTAGGGIFDETVAVWIDADRNGSFDASEFSFIGNTTGGTLTANVNVPANALLGQTRMRVRVRFATPLTGADACTGYIYGETEDYTVNIIPCVQGVFNTQPVAPVVTCGDDALIFAAASGTYLQYQWQQQAAGSSTWTNVAGATNDTLIITAVTGANDGTRYRVLISGGCTAIDFSDAITLTVNPLVINVNPSSYSTCAPIPQSAPVALSITNVSGGATFTTTDYASTITTPVLIPDADPAGISNTIAVPALPAGATISAARVTLNITHPYVGDLVIVLKAPNGNIFSLDYLINSTGGPGVTTGFTNTVIGSNGVVRLDAGTDPWTGLFAPDALITPPAGFPPAGPTSVGQPNVSNFSDLFSVPDGNWEIGIYDAGAIDEGSLLNWTLTLVYSTAVVTPFTGVWSPATGLYSDAAGTIPYVAGTEATTVYAAPAATTIYTVTVSNPICPSAPVEVPVRILSPDPTVTVSALPYTNLYPGLSTNAVASVTPAGPNATYQWFSNGVAIAGATGSSYLAGVDNIGTLSVVVSDSTTCSGSATASLELRDSLVTTLFIYPNPNNGMFQVRFNDQVNDLQMRPRMLNVYDAKGSRVYSRSYAITGIYSRMDVDMSGFPKGVYVVDLTDASGRRLSTGRVLVK